MRILVGHGGVETFLYEAGDFVRLCRDEDGPIVTAFAGDWGCVVRVHPDGSLDINFAGHSRPRGAALARAVAIRSSRVQPCDARGRPRPPGKAVVWDTHKAR